LRKGRPAFSLRMPEWAGQQVSFVFHGARGLDEHGPVGKWLSVGEYLPPERRKALFGVSRQVYRNVEIGFCC